MSTIAKNWHILPQAPLEHLSRYEKMHPILAQVLINRGQDTPERAYHFLYDKEHKTDPFEMKDIQKAVERITKAIHSKEKIVVYGDFDADGVTATTLLMRVLTRLKANVKAYIPHRVDEGYGLNSQALRTLAERGFKLVITVDCGIRSVQEVRDGQAAGLDIIITDHHSVGPEIPDAYAVVNPQQVDCPGDTTLAGVGVAYMLARALLLHAWKRLGRRKEHLLIYDALVREVKDLVAIGTVADIMPLNAVGNRALVRQGLEVLNEARTPGVRALLDVSGIKPGEVTAMSIGFGLGPRINAAGRLDRAMIAHELFMAPTYDQARPLAEKLQDLNKRRQTLTREAQARIEEQIDAASTDLIFAEDTGVSQGIVGLVAGRLTEAYFRPSVVVQRGEHESHASCRSIPQFHITKALDDCADLLVRHGGHAMAAGLTVHNENLPALREHLLDHAKRQLEGQDLTPTLKVDMELDRGQLDMALAEELERLEPTGHENPPPVFVTREMTVLSSRTVGSDDAHLKLTLSDGQRDEPIDAIGFRQGHWAADMPDRIDVAYHLEINEWNGRRTLQMNLRDLKIPQEGAAD